MNKKIALWLTALTIPILTLAIIMYIKQGMWWWDEAIYIGMARFISSAGTIAGGENFRPIGLPIIIAGLNSIGIALQTIRLIVPLIFSITLIIATWKVSEQIKKETGIWSALLLTSSAVFLTFSPYILTDIPSTTIALCAYIALFKKKNILAGTLIGIATLIRFPQGIHLAPIGIYLIHPWIFNRTKTQFKNATTAGLKVLLGFAIPALPYLTITTIIYGNPITPLINAVQVLKYVAPINPQGAVFYIQKLAEHNTRTIILLIISAIFFFTNQQWKNKEQTTIFTAGILPLAYLTFLAPHKESRYALLFLAPITIIAGITIKQILQYLSQHTKLLLKTTISALIIIFLASLIIINTQKATTLINSYTPEEQAYYKYFETIKGQKEQLLITNPTITIYTTAPTKYLGGWEYATTTIAQNPNATHIAYNNCDYICPPENKACEQGKQTFLKQLKTYKLLFNTTAKECEMKVYEMK